MFIHNTLTPSTACLAGVPGDRRGPLLGRGPAPTAPVLQSPPLITSTAFFRVRGLRTGAISPVPTFYDSGVWPFTITTTWFALCTCGLTTAFKGVVNTVQASPFKQLLISPETPPWTTHCPVPTPSSWTRAPRPGQPRPSINHFKFTPLRRCLAETAYAHD